MTFDSSEVFLSKVSPFVTRLLIASQQRRGLPPRADAVENRPVRVRDQQHVERRPDAAREERAQDGRQRHRGTDALLLAIRGALQTKEPPLRTFVEATPHLARLRLPGLRDARASCHVLRWILVAERANEAGEHLHTAVDLRREHRQQPEISAGVVGHLIAVVREVHGRHHPHDDERDQQRHPRALRHGLAAPAVAFALGHHHST